MSLDELEKLMTEVLEEKKKEKKSTSRKQSSISRKSASTSRKIVLTEDQLQALIASAVQNAIKELTEPSVRNIVLKTWDTEPSGAKNYMYLSIFGREKAGVLKENLRLLLDANILVKDRNGWVHVNPIFLREILEYFGIPFDTEELTRVQKAVLRRMEKEIKEPDFSIL